MCGKNASFSITKSLTSGSPPRVREKHYSSTCDIAILRITPACAGKTPRYVVRFLGGEDHPRVCGKNEKEGVTIDFGLGSPPRVREKRDGSKVGSHYARITPACAGKTPLIYLVLLPRQDHPRVCGKNTATRTFFTFNLGSPPRVREKLDRKKLDAKELGITPACAGKTLPIVYREQEN